MQARGKQQTTSWCRMEQIRTVFAVAMTNKIQMAQQLVSGRQIPRKRCALWMTRPLRIRRRTLTDASPMSSDTETTMPGHQRNTQKDVNATVDNTMKTRMTGATSAATRTSFTHRCAVKSPELQSRTATWSESSTSELNSVPDLCCRPIQGMPRMISWM